MKIPGFVTCRFSKLEQNTKMSVHESDKRCRFVLDDGTQCTEFASNGPFCNAHCINQEIDVTIYNAIHNHFLQDLREFWHRSNFYLAVQTGLVAAFVLKDGSDDPFTIAVSAGLCLLGICHSLVWGIVARGSLLWIRKWRNELIRLDRIIDRHQSFYTVEKYADDQPLMSPSNITQFLPYVFVVIWIAAVILLVIYRS